MITVQSPWEKLKKIFKFRWKGEIKVHYVFVVFSLSLYNKTPSNLKHFYDLDLQLCPSNLSVSLSSSIIFISIIFITLLFYQHYYFIDFIIIIILLLYYYYYFIIIIIFKFHPEEYKYPEYSLEYFRVFQTDNNIS